MHKTPSTSSARALLQIALGLTLTIFAIPNFGVAQTEEKVGVRPYEMDWAGRTEETRPALVDFESLDGWTVETRNAVATFERSREEQMYGEHVGKLTYRKGDGAGTPGVDIRPPAPIAFPSDADAYSCWIVGNNWGWVTDASTPRVNVSVLIKDSDGKELALPLAYVNWKEWFLCYKIIAEGTRKYLGDSPVFTGIRVEGGTNEEDRTLYFDSLCFFKEERAPLETSKRPKPGIDLFEGQDLGVNDGEGRLPFPTTPDTILPDSASKIRTPMFHFYGDSCDFVYTGSDGELVYKYKPSTGAWTDFTATWGTKEPFLPLEGGGVRKLVGENGELELIDTAELLKFESTDDGAVAVWKMTSKTATAEVEYRMQIKGKSLIIDTIARGGRVPEVVFGRIFNVGQAKTYSIPYYLYDYDQRPGVASFIVRHAKRAAEAESLFASGHIDWYRSSASYLRGKHGVEEYVQPTADSAALGGILMGGMGGAAVGMGGDKKYRAIVNGGAEYRPKTNGERNDVYERFIFTVSPKFEEVLPTIPNPPSPYKAVAGSGVWRSHGATTRERDKNYWREVWRRGMRHLIVTDHEVCWRDGGESFTFRTKPAPEKGGDEGWFDYARFMQDELGFVYGPYNNFTDFAPVNEYWSPDMIGRFSDWQLQPAWMRCYAPKPIRAVEYCEKLTPINEEKFHFSCAYCDVHSSVPPWTRTDYDERVPGAGTFMSVYYPYGEIFLLQKKNWDGPTYSEGPHHCFYAGLTDGNYAQDQPYNLFKNPWLVDFDLRKMHDLEVDFGMGNVGMFAPGYKPTTDEEKEALVDRFITATLAFGHSGFFAADFGWRMAARSYFMTQQIASQYTQSSVKSILYFDERSPSKWVEVSEALQNDVVKNNQIKVEYENGVIVVVNGSEEKMLETEVGGRRILLSGNSYVAWTADDKILVQSYETPTGGRFDYCESPEYIYLDGRGEWVERRRACGSGAGVCRIVSENEFEFIPYDGAELGFKIASDDEVVEAVAFDFNQNEMGKARVKRSRGYVFLDKIEGAFSYKVTKRARTDDDPKPIQAQRLNPNLFVVSPHQSVQLLVDGQVLTWSAPEMSKQYATGTLRYVEGATLYQRGWRETPTPFMHIWTVPKAGVYFDFLVVPHHNMHLFSWREPSDAFPNTISGYGRTLKYMNSNDEYAWSNAGGRILSEKFPEPKEEGEEDVQSIEVKTIVDRFGKYDRVEFAKYVFTSDVEREYRRREPFPFPMTDPRSYVAYVQRFEQEPTTELEGTGATAFRTLAVCGEETKECVKIHPPYKDGPTGRTYLEYGPIYMTQYPENFKLWVGKQNGSDPGDGINFKVEVIVQKPTPNGMEETKEIVAEQLVTEHEWKELVADMSPFVNKQIKFRVIAEANENPNGDWACVSGMRFESQEGKLVRKFKDVKRVETGIKVVDAE